MEIRDVIMAAAALGAQMALEAAGCTSGDITYNQAKKTYGAWFVEAVRAGRLYPSRVGKGPHATRWYSVREILSLRTADIMPAKLLTI